MRRRRPSGIAIAAAVATVILLLLLQLKLDFHLGARAEAFKQKLIPGSLNKIATPPTEPAPKPAPPVSLLQKISIESELIGQTTESPEALEKGLDDWAHSLSANDIQELRQVLFSENMNGDEVALSLDLLGRSDLPSAQEVLIDYVLSPPTSNPTEQGAFQLLALDGIIDQSARSNNPQALKQVQAQSSDTMVARRAAQGLRALQGKGPWPEETDRQALNELLEKSHHE